MQLAVGLLLPFLGTTLGAACVFFYERADEAACSEDASGICVGSDGGGIGVVASDSGNGYVGGDGEICIYPGGSRIFTWNFVFAWNGPGSTASPYGSRMCGGA